MTKAKRGDGTVGKALEVLDLVAREGRAVRFTELLGKSTYPKATLYRFLQTLTSQGMLAYDDQRQVYNLGLRLVRLAHAAWAQSSLAPVAQVHVDALSHLIGETVHLAQLDHGHVLYVDKRNARDPIEMFSQAGKVGPAYCTGVGKAMLAFLDTPERDEPMAQQSYHRFTANTLVSAAALETELAAIRTAGFAFDREEHEPHIICVAVPIIAASGRVLGGLSVTSSTARASLAQLQNHVPALLASARSIAADAEIWRFPETVRAETRSEA